MVDDRIARTHGSFPEVAWGDVAASSRLAAAIGMVTGSMAVSATALSGMSPSQKRPSAGSCAHKQS